jgi:hypothetical protein
MTATAARRRAPATSAPRGMLAAGALRLVEPAITLTEAMSDPHLLGGPFKAASFWTWKTVAKLLDGEPLDGREAALFRECTGRTKLPTAPVRRMALLCGRRGGKDRWLSAVAVWRSALAFNWKLHMSLGEPAVVLLCGADRRQASILRKYCEGLLQVPLLAQEVVRSSDDVVEFKNGSILEVATNDARLIRGRSAIAVLGSECCHWKTDETSLSSDEEVVAAAEPSMAMIPDGGLLLLGSSVHRRRGFMYRQWKERYGREDDAEDGLGPVVWLAPSATMNPALPAGVVRRALADDPWRAKGEYLSEWRDDSSGFIDREAVEAAVDAGVRERLPSASMGYHAFVDPAGGSGTDSVVLAIAHRERDGRAVLDVLREVRPKFSPSGVVTEFAQLLRGFRISRVTGDHYAGEFAREPFRLAGIQYEVSERNKSDIYRDFLPLINSGNVRLLDVPKLVSQLCQLERKTGTAGRDTIDHPKGSAFHDDLANAAAGALLMCSSKPTLIVPSSVVAAGRRFAPPNPWWVT